MGKGTGQQQRSGRLTVEARWRASVALLPTWVKLWDVLLRDATERRADSAEDGKEGHGTKQGDQEGA